MAEKLNAVNFTSGKSMEDASDKGILNDAVRVSGEGSKVLIGELNNGIGNGWKSRRIFDLVGRVLNGPSCMDEKVKDVKRPESGPEVDSSIAPNSVDMNMWRGAVDEPTFRSYLGVGNDLSRDQDSVSNKLVTYGKLEIEEQNNVDIDPLIPQTRGERNITEKEGEYFESDLVWGKVKSHPWWPGQVFSPKAATNMAAKHYKKGCHLVAYFGDGTFAWNEESKIKPFGMYFSQMEKQSNAEGFHHAVDCALDEVTRRVDFALSCPCLPKEVLDKIKYQVVENAGVVEKYSRREGGDNLYSAALFRPEGVMQFVESLAVSRETNTDRLQFVIRKAQLVACKRWKGHYRLPVFEECGVLSEDVITELVEGSKVANNKEKNVVIIDLDSEEHEEHYPTALTINFRNFEGIPSTANLNEIFRQYGPLRESETETSSNGRSNRAKVIFVRREDADKASSSAPSIFGASFVSYRLKCLPTPHNKAKRKKKDVSTKINDS